MAEQVVAIDNGEVLSKEDLKKAWPEFAKMAFKKKVSVDDFIGYDKAFIYIIRKVGDKWVLIGMGG